MGKIDIGGAPLCAAFTAMLSLATLSLATLPVSATAGEADVISAQQLQVSERVTLAGYIAPDAIDGIETADIVVIDLRTPPEGIEQEQHELESRGVTYVNLPTGRTLSSAQVRRFGEVLERFEGRDIVIHCASGNRAGMLWAAHLSDQGVPVDEALKVVDPIVTKPAVTQAVQAYATAPADE